MAYTAQQIRDFIAQQGIGGDPGAIYHAARAYGITGRQLDEAMGWSPGTADGWVQQNGRNPLTSEITQPFQVSSPPAQQPLQQANPYLQQTAPQQAAQQQMPALPLSSGVAQQPITQTQRPAPNPYRPNPTGSATQPMSNPYLSQAGTQQVPQQQQTQQQGDYRSNPATAWMADAMGQQIGQHLQRNILPGIRSAASAAGGLGGSRQGIAEGVAIGDAMTGYGNALANLYGTQYNADRGYGLQSDALDLNVYNANQGWARQGQQDQISLLGNLLGWNQNAIGNATTAQNTPMNYWQQFGNTGAQLGGLGGTNSQNMQGNPYLSAIGGAMTGYNLWKNWGG